MAPYADDTISTATAPLPSKMLYLIGDVPPQAALNVDPQEREAPNGEAKESPDPTHHSPHSSPLQLKVVLNDFKSFDVTPVIGKEFPEAKLADWLRASNSDEIIRDLAITGQAVSIGERPYLDVKSKSRQEALRESSGERNGGVGNGNSES